MQFLPVALRLLIIMGLFDLAAPIALHVRDFQIISKCEYTYYDHSRWQLAVCFERFPQVSSVPGGHVQSRPQSLIDNMILCRTGSSV